ADAERQLGQAGAARRGRREDGGRGRSGEGQVAVAHPARDPHRGVGRVGDGSRRVHPGATPLAAGGHALRGPGGRGQAHEQGRRRRGGAAQAPAHAAVPASVARSLRTSVALTMRRWRALCLGWQVVSVRVASSGVLATTSVWWGYTTKGSWFTS